ncbi:MAG: helical backbone metal receptor [Acidimicrobiales bacterium]
MARPTANLRIVSLVPSVTETLSAWGHSPVACTRFCERPDLLHIGGTKNPNVDDIIKLRPDLIVVDAEENRREDYDSLVARGLDVHVLRIQSLADVNSAMVNLAQRVGVRWKPPNLLPSVAHRRNAFVPIWRKPWMALGTPTYGASVLLHLGVATVFAGQGPYPTTSLDEAIECHPDVVLAPSEPYPFTKRQLPELSRVAPTLFIDGRDLFWWGARTEGALVRLAAVLNAL